MATFGSRVARVNHECSEAIAMDAPAAWAEAFGSFVRVRDAVPIAPSPRPSPPPGARGSKTKPLSIPGRGPG